MMQILAEYYQFSGMIIKKEIRCPELKATASEKTQFLSWEMSLFEVDNNVTKILPSRCSINLAEALSKQEQLRNLINTLPRSFFPPTTNKKSLTSDRLSKIFRRCWHLEGNE